MKENFAAFAAASDLAGIAHDVPPVRADHIESIERASIATATGIPVILNPSPLTSEFIQSRAETDTLILSALEGSRLFRRRTPRSTPTRNAHAPPPVAAK